jgi:hypothetical protein
MKTNNVYYSVKTKSQSGQISHSDGGPYSSVSAALFAIARVAEQVEDDLGGEILSCRTKFGAYSDITVDALRGNQPTPDKYGCPNCLAEGFIDAPCDVCGRKANPSLT